MEVMFSIIVPIYNVEMYLEECIDSIINQTYCNIEVILVDDGSKDGSSIICDRYNKIDDRIKVIHKQNGGLSDARNEGVKIASGRYILFVDGDDYIEKESLIEIEKIIKKEKEPDIICLELVKFFEYNQKMVMMNDGINEKINELRNDELYEYLAALPKYPASACTKAIRRDFFLDNNLFFVKDLLSEDLEWCIRILIKAQRISYCPCKYYFYRQARVNSISNTNSEKKVMDILSTYQKWTDYVLDSKYSAKNKMICSYMEYVFRFLILGYKDVAFERRNEFRKKVKSKSWVLGTRHDKQSILIRLCYRIFGINVTGKLLSEYLKRRY